MERFRNHWHLYEFLKSRFMANGRVPTADEARAEFPELSLEEMGEGFAEFEIMIPRFEERSVAEQCIS